MELAILKTYNSYLESTKNPQTMILDKVLRVFHGYKRIKKMKNCRNSVDSVAGASS